MLRDITIGQYYPADSVIHKLDPRVKLFATLIFIISLFSFKNVWGFLVATIFMFGFIELSKVPIGYMVKGLKAIVILMIITALFNLFLTSGKELVSFWIFTITYEGLRNAILMAIRLTYLILGTSVMTLTTTPNELTDGLEKALAPMNKIHVPVHEIAMMMSIALRFIPILVEETDKIMRAQMARGADFETGGVIQRAKNMIPLLVPLFVSAFRRANDLAMAMEARCYRGGAGRTKMKPLKYVSIDYRAYVIVILYFVICPAVCGGSFGAPGVNSVLFMALFHAGWFVESLWSQTLVIHMIRTPKVPFIQSRASLPVLVITTIAIIVGTVIPYTPLGAGLGMVALPAIYFAWLAGIIFAYMVLITVVKKIFVKKYGDLL